jgi:hypothetical protein
MTWQELLAKHHTMFNGVKKVWQPEELSIAYQIYNGHYNTNLRDTGCGSCRRSVLAHCHKIATKFASEGLPNLNDNASDDN